MAHYEVNKTVNPRYAHSLLITPPLAIILVSCFIFVLMQPSPPKRVAPAASSHSKPSLNQPKSVLNMAQNNTLPLIEPVVVDQNTSGVPGNIATTTPQPANSSASSLQSASTNNQQLSTYISVPTSSSKSKKFNITNTIKKATSSKR